MNKKLVIVLWALLALAGIAFICLTAETIVFAYIRQNYGKMALYLVIDLLCAERAGTAIARLIKLWKGKKA